MRATPIALLLGLLGCSSSPEPAVQATASDPSAPTMSASGTVQTIRFQNINKAKGHYTYNVELLLVHEGLADAPYPGDREPGTLRVRVHKVYWSRLSDAEKASIAPDGPAQVMEVPRWRDYASGEDVELSLVSLGPGLSALSQ